MEECLVPWLVAFLQPILLLGLSVVVSNILQRCDIAIALCICISMALTRLTATYLLCFTSSSYGASDQ